jgi:HK97 family phage portal protein
MISILKNWMKRKSSFEHTIARMIRGDEGHKSTGWSKRSYRGYAHEAYEKNVVAYSCINNISQAVASVPIIIKSGDKEITTGPIVELLKRPNPLQSYNTFMRMAVMYRLISGNTYIHNLRVYTKRIMQMELLQPGRVQILTTKECEPYAYQYTVGGKTFTYDIDPGTQMSDVLHIKESHPYDDLYGMSPISAAILSIEQHNASIAWNKILLDNSARPPGVFKLKDRSDGSPSPDQKTLDDIGDRLNEKYGGYKRAGKIPVIGFDMDWLNMGMSPNDMDWLNGKNSSARDICLALGYPAFLLGLPEGATYNNVAEAKLALYEDTVIPLAESMYSEIAYYISQQQGTPIEICPNLDRVSALTPRREATRKNARDDLLAGVITTNEAREEGNYEPVDGGDEILVPAGKLPINFDTADMTAPKYHDWLLREGFTKEQASEFTKIAYAKSPIAG